MATAEGRGLGPPIHTGTARYEGDVHESADKQRAVRFVATCRGTDIGYYVRVVLCGDKTDHRENTRLLEHIRSAVREVLRETLDAQWVAFPSYREMRGKVAVERPQTRDGKWVPATGPTTGDRLEEVPGGDEVGLSIYRPGALNGIFYSDARDVLAVEQAVIGAVLSYEGP